MSQRTPAYVTVDLPTDLDDDGIHVFPLIGSDRVSVQIEAAVWARIKCRVRAYARQERALLAVDRAAAKHNGRG